MTGSTIDRAAIKLHDIGLELVQNDAGEIGLKVLVGGGMGRTPMLGHVIREWLPVADYLSYMEAILRVYNRHGRRDNIYKARIKILVNDLGAAEFARQVEEEWVLVKPLGLDPPPSELARIAAHFAPPVLDANAPVEIDQSNPDFANWVTVNTHPHRAPVYAIVTISLKAPGEIPGDASADQMDIIADLAQRYAGDEIRVGVVPDCLVSQFLQVSRF